MHSCLGAVKTSMLVIQRAQEAITATLLAKQCDNTLEETLSCLLDCYVHILTDGKTQCRLHGPTYTNYEGVVNSVDLLVSR